MLILAMAGIARAQVSGDVDCNGSVNLADSLALVAALFTDPPSTCPTADVNADGSISSPDIVALLGVLDPALGPTITYIGLAGADGAIVRPLGTTAGTPVFFRNTGFGFLLVVEGRTGPSGAPPGVVTFNAVANDPTRRPDLQIESSNPLGDGTPAICDGAVPAVQPPDFGQGQAIANALNDFSCGFVATTSARSACTLNAFGSAAFMASGTQVQFCGSVPAAMSFPDGETVLTTRLRDTAGNLGPTAQLIIQVGQGAPPGTFTTTPTRIASATPTSTPTLPPTPSASSTPTASRTRTPSGTPVAPTATASPSRTPTRTPPPIATTAAPSATSTPAVSRTVPPSASPTRAGSATPSATAPRQGTATPTLTRPSPTTQRGTPSATPSPTRSVTPTPSASATHINSATPTPTRTPARSKTPTALPTPTPTLIGPAGPVVTFFGITRADDTLVPADGTTSTGIPIYSRLTGSGFSLIIEGAPGADGAPVGTSAFQPTLTDFPDLQIAVSNPLGNGSTAVCDDTGSTAGGVPATSVPDFALTQVNINTVNDLACRFVDGTGAPVGRNANDSCVLFPSGAFTFVASGSRVQFCGFITRVAAFPPGDTLVTARLRDALGNTGPIAQIVIHIGS